MKRFHMMASDHDLPYGIEGGTLLGAVRDRGIIVHDDDIDLYITGEDTYSLIPTVCEQYGLQALETKGWKGYKLWGVEEYDVESDDAIHAPFIDVFFRVLRETDSGDRYVTIGAFEDVFLTRSEVESPAIYKLDGLYLHGPAHASSPGGYLERVYGGDWCVPVRYDAHINALRPDRLENRTFDGFKSDQVALAVRYADADPKMPCTSHAMAVRTVASNPDPDPDPDPDSGGIPLAAWVGIVVAVIVAIALGSVFARRGSKRHRQRR